MHLDFDFDGPVDLDRVELRCSHDQWQISLQLDGIDAELDKLDGPVMPDLRRLATGVIRTHGIDYLMIGKDYEASNDIADDPARWGLRLAAQQESGRLYEIQ